MELEAVTAIIWEEATQEVEWVADPPWEVVDKCSNL
jgi:hypothetical protein